MGGARNCRMVTGRGGAGVVMMSAETVAAVQGSPAASPTAARSASISWPLGLAGGVLIALMAVAAPNAQKATYDAFVYLGLAQGAVFVGAVWWLMRRGGRARDLWLILAVALVIRAIGFAAPHDGLTTDAYRYVWDGRIQWDGWSPYALVPADPQLAHLRDDTVYPNINQKERAVTIYPPFAQVLFAAGNRIADDVTGPKVVMALADLATIAVLLALLPLAGLSRDRVLIYAWHPLPVWELVSQAHIDAAAIAMMMLAVLAVWQRRQGVAGGWLALAVMTKYFPLAIIPVIWRRWDWRMPAAFVGVCLAVAAPYALTADDAPLSGYLVKHLDNEGYGAGWGFHPVWMLRDFEIGDMPGRLYTVLALIVLAALGAWAFFVRARDELRPENLVLIAAAFIWLTSPHYPWYFCWLIPFLCLWVSPAALGMSIFAVALYHTRPPDGVSWTELYALVFYAPVVMALAHLVWAKRARR